MIPELGHFALAIGCALAFAQAFIGIWGAHRRDLRLMSAVPGLAVGQLLALAGASLALVLAAAGDDFSVVNIAENSAIAKPLLYKITGTWGNHEGSILLWGLILAICGGLVASFGRTLPTALRSRVLGVLGGTSAGFLLFCLLTSNPFLRAFPAPLDGRGMNPLLQDPGLAFHPPILYMGYVGFAVPFAFAVAALLEGRIDAAWGRWVRPWALVSWCFLTCGIAMGSWWAYYELGWGGYWFWDPVENASLMPWLTGTALVHSAIVVEKRESLKIWTVLLAIGTFSLSLSGTFLVRSGILNSVHAFAQDPARGVFILGLLGLVIGGSLLLFALRAPLLKSGGIFAPVSREGALVMNNILLCSVCAVVVVGTLYPPFADLLLGQKISVGAPFFNATVLPLAIPLFAAMAVGPLLPWKRGRLWPLVVHAWWAALAASVVAGVCLIGMKVLPALAFGVAAWLILGSFAEVVERTLLFRAPMANSVRRARGLPVAVLGAAIAHAGMGVTVAGIAGMSLASNKIVEAHAGDSFHVGGYDWTLISVDDQKGPNYAARVAAIEVTRNGHPVAMMRPSRRNFQSQNQTTSDVAIRTNLMRDLYAVLGDERDGAAVLRLHVNPLAPWIWLGAVVMALGGGLSLADRRLRVGAPSRIRGAVPGMTDGIARRRLLLLAPLAVVAAGGAAFWTMLDRMQTGRFDPHDIGNPMLGKKIPSFNLPALPPNKGFSSKDVIAAARTKPVIVNFFASWCIPCAQEAEALASLEAQGAQLWGINYEDKPDKAQAFLDQYGNPYARVAVDTTGGTFIDFGLFGVPESFLVDASGTITWHLAGPISDSVIETQLKGRA